MSAQRIIWPIALPLALLIVVACGDAEEQLPENAPASTSVSASATPAPPEPGTPTPTSSDIPFDWKTYTDPDHGFSLRYPPDFVFEDISDPSSPLSQRVLQFKSPDGTNIGFALVIADNTKSLSAEDWAREFSTCALEAGHEVAAITVDGGNGVTCLGEPIAGKFETVVVLTRDKTIMYLTSTLSERDFERVISGLDLS